MVGMDDESIVACAKKLVACTAAARKMEELPVPFVQLPALVAAELN